MHEEYLDVIEIEVDDEDLQRLKAIFAPVELTPEQLIQRFFAWCVDPMTRDKAAAWLLKCRRELP